MLRNPANFYVKIDKKSRGDDMKLGFFTMPLILLVILIIADQSYAGKKDNHTLTEAELLYVFGCEYYTGDQVQQDYKQAVQLFRKSAEKGFAESQFRMGVAYSIGKGEVQDYSQAAKWFKKAADQNHADAQFRLGLFHLLGYCGAKDLSQAIQWFQKAADQGHVNAQIYLGNSYGSGDGVPQDFMKAYLWYNLAAASGNEEVKKKRDAFLEVLDFAQIAEAQKMAADWTEKHPVNKYNQVKP